MSGLRNVAAAAFAALAFGCANSAGAVDKPLITNFTEENVKGVIAELSGTDVSTQKTDDGSVTFVKFTLGDRSYLALLLACTAAEGCRGLQVGAAFGGQNSVATVNSFNTDYPFGKAFVTPKGTMVSSRYVIADYGITRENVMSEFRNLFSITDLLLTYVKEHTIASAKPPTVLLSGPAANPAAAHAGPAASAFDRAVNPAK